MHIQLIVRCVSKSPLHSCEHLLNAYMVKHFGCPRSKNAHIEKKKCKCDYILEQCPTDAQIAEIEAEINRMIAASLPVAIEFMSRDEAATIVDLSKLPEDASEPRLQ